MSKQEITHRSKWMSFCGDRMGTGGKRAEDDATWQEGGGPHNAVYRLGAHSSAAAWENRKFIPAVGGYVPHAGGNTGMTFQNSILPRRE